MGGQFIFPLGMDLTVNGGICGRGWASIKVILRLAVGGPDLDMICIECDAVVFGKAKSHNRMQLKLPMVGDQDPTSHSLVSE